jgi:hypothetical protein
MSIEQMFMMQT